MKVCISYAVIETHIDKSEAQVAFYQAAVMVLLVTSLLECDALERDLTINVDAGKTDCFYQQVTAGHMVDIEYQVIDGGQGGLDVGFILIGPGGRVLAAPGRRQAGSHRAPAPDTGDYRFCFDNSHSKFNAKTIYFDVMIESEDDEDDNEDEAENSEKWNKINEKDGDSEQVTEWHERLNDLVGRLRHNLAGARRLQEAVSVIATRDLHYAERSLWRVTVCSATQALAMLLVGVLQVVMVRSLFDDTSPVHGLLKKIPIGRS